MILHSLNDLYGRLQTDLDYRIAPPGYSLQKVTFRVVLRPDGRLFEIQPVGTPTKAFQQILVPGQAKPSGSGINPCFLWDNSGYLLGYKTADKDDCERMERHRATFAAFRDRHLNLRGTIEFQEFAAVCHFLEEWDPADAAEHPVLDDAAKTGFGVFQIQGTKGYVHDASAVRAWWESQPLDDEGALKGQCLVTGEEAPLARLHEKVKGVRGAQTAGAAIVSFNDAAYESYGKTQSFNAPVASDVAFRYVTALNALLSGPMSSRHRIGLGDMTVAFWTDRPTATEDIFAQFAQEGSRVVEATQDQDEGVRQKVSAFLSALRQGRPAYPELGDSPDETSFYVLGLAPNAARLSVRFFHRGTVSELLDNLRRHHGDISVARRVGTSRSDDLEFPPGWQLLRQAAREAKDVPASLGGGLLRSIITGAPYPHTLYSAVLRRIQADRHISYLRACVLKGYLNRNLTRGVTVSLDVLRPDPAYRVGRLFAALEKTQRDALGERLNTTIRDSFYGAASVTPSVVFPRLLRTYQHHLSKLDIGHRINREKLVQEIVDPLSGFPNHLNLAEQGMFAIGYYHQSRAFYTKHQPVDTGSPPEGTDS